MGLLGYEDIGSNAYAPFPIYGRYNVRITIVFEDERILALSKPAGQPSIPGRGEIGEPLNLAQRVIPAPRCSVVHRLDREASGLIVFAKDAAMHRELCARFEAHEVRKRYITAVQGK